METPRKELPLRKVTPDAWAEVALEDPVKLLNDHAHLEKKAALNALDLLLVWPSAHPPEGWTKVLSAIAKDEVHHLATVLKLLEKYGGVMSKGHRSEYAQQLRQLVRRGEGPLEVIDRLLVSAMIEARSAERFEILGRCCKDAVLTKLYRGLWASEQGHYRIFLETARKAAAVSGNEDACEERWDEFLDRESEIISSQARKPLLHSWV
jgi:tRNA-(ms[2]io[6]A)-hydroxylase